MTLPVCRSWFPVGARLAVPYEAPQGRRVNAIGAHFTHGPAAGRFAYQTWAALPKSRAKQPRKTPAEVAAAHGLPLDEVGPIDSERFLAFVWHLAGRAADAPAGWRRERPLMVVLDNYSVHTSQTVAAASPSSRERMCTWCTCRRTVRSCRRSSRTGMRSNSISCRCAASPTSLT